MPATSADGCGGVAALRPEQPLAGVAQVGGAGDAVDGVGRDRDRVARRASARQAARDRRTSPAPSASTVAFDPAEVTFGAHLGEPALTQQGATAAACPRPSSSTSQPPRSQARRARRRPRDGSGRGRRHRRTARRAARGRGRPARPAGRRRGRTGRFAAITSKRSPAGEARVEVGVRGTAARGPRRVGVLGASASASASTSTAVTTASGRSLATASAIAPLPVPRSSSAPPSGSRASASSTSALGLGPRHERAGVGA